MNRVFLLLLFLFTTFSWSQNIEADLNTIQNEKPKNIIFLIGDGMGLSQVSASLYFNENPSNFERFQTIGLIKTSSSAELITDSAAGATAFASGVKTYNGAIGVTADTISVPTIVELVSKKGYATGIVSTSSVVHATPASFFAHVKQRRLYEDIADFIPKSDLDFIAGGGTKFFNSRTDSKNLFPVLEQNNFEVHTIALPKTLSDKKHIILLAKNGMPKMLDGRGDFLPNATQLGINYLSKNENGFFIMIEGSQIDWGGHDNDAEYLISELIDFDNAIGLALDFAQKNGETLVIVTADHETGGFTLAPNDRDYNKIKPNFSTKGHSATLIPVFAYGPGAEIFSGIYENTEIFHKLMALLED